MMLYSIAVLFVSLIFDDGELVGIQIFNKKLYFSGDPSFVILSAFLKKSMYPVITFLICNFRDSSLDF